MTYSNLNTGKSLCSTNAIARSDRSHHILCLSADNPADLKKLASQFKQILATLPPNLLADLCFTANTSRPHLTYRLAVVGDSVEHMHQQLAAFVTGKDTPSIKQGISNNNKKSLEIAFLFTGQGSQIPQMGRQLYATQPTFRKALNLCNKLLCPYLRHSLLSVIFPNPEEPVQLHETIYTQPALFALEYSLVQMWCSWGIKPAAVMGHSVGEYIAACTAGVFSLEDGLKLIAQRAKLMQDLPKRGKMVVLSADEALVAAKLEPYAQEVSIAAVNGSKNVVISGTEQAVQIILELLQAEGVVAKSLIVSHAFHSPLMEPILPQFKEIAQEVIYAEPMIELVSNLTGKLICPGEITQANYWCQHIRKTVRFAEGMTTLALQRGYETFLEVGPHPTLLNLGKHCLPPKTGKLWLNTLNRRETDWKEVSTSLAALYAEGIHIDWAGFDKDYHRCQIALPDYPI
ncbi:MAG: hypothetical protein C6Y22_24950 [Hapalosiphonaceae cyanobacterium JJU2]|nr:MAG: hypothetical protein C6Y22_24950 [Hapalosiphonaceae cyanobacterium JJU2]